MCCPVSFNILKGLLKKERKILSFIVIQGQTLDVNVTILLRVLLKEDNLESNFVECLK